MTQNTITFIGGGNMARSLIGGLIADGCDPARIHVADPDAGQRDALQTAFSVITHDDNTEALQNADVVILAVKPQIIRQVATGIGSALQTAPVLVMSIAAGIRVDALQRWLGASLPVVRTMPNTPALVQSGATALFASPEVDAAQRDLSERIMRAVGITLWVDDEAQLDAVTALSGSGPAYYFLVMQAMEAAGQQLGLSAETARLLTLQTAFGAAKLALESHEDPALLRQQVTSPGGTTERAIETLQGGRFMELFADALLAARERATELSDQLGED
jgi:pyrroline-5-carboxylate reductase